MINMSLYICTGNGSFRAAHEEDIAIRGYVRAPGPEAVPKSSISRALDAILDADPPWGEEGRSVIESMRHWLADEADHDCPQNAGIECIEPTCEGVECGQRESTDAAPLDEIRRTVGLPPDATPWAVVTAVRDALRRHATERSDALVIADHYGFVAVQGLAGKVEAMGRRIRTVEMERDEAQTCFATRLRLAGVPVDGTDAWPSIMRLIQERDSAVARKSAAEEELASAQALQDRWMERATTAERELEGARSGALHPNARMALDQLKRWLQSGDNAPFRGGAEWRAAGYPITSAGDGDVERRSKHTDDLGEHMNVATKRIAELESELAFLRSRPALTPEVVERIAALGEKRAIDRQIIADAKERIYQIGDELAAMCAPTVTDPRD